MKNNPEKISLFIIYIKRTEFSHNLEDYARLRYNLIWFLTLRNPLKTSLSEETWWRLSRMMTLGKSVALCSHWSATLDRYWRSSRPDLRSTLNVAIESAVSFSASLKSRINKEFCLRQNRRTATIEVENWWRSLLVQCLRRTHRRTKNSASFLAR